MLLLRRVIIAVVFIFPLTAYAELVLIIPDKHFELRGNYVTGAAMYAACVALVTPTLNDVTRFCGASAPVVPPEGYSSIVAGWLYDYAVPNWNGNSYYINVVACTNSNKIRYFADVNKCVAITQATVLPPASPKGNGPSCPTSGANIQPSCGNPISIGNANKVQQEVDFWSKSARMPFSIVRTYNNGPFSVDFDSRGGFGSRWSYTGDRRLEFRENLIQRNCFTRSDNGAIFCENAPVPGSPKSVIAKRPDGKAFTFSPVGTAWTGESDVAERLTMEVADDGITAAGWTFIAGQDDIEKYDANGKLLSVTDRAGNSHFYTYSTGESNDSSSSRYPNSAPVCSNVQAGASVKAGLLLCVTDNSGRSMQYEYDGVARIIKILDPDNHVYLYNYDGPSGGCAASPGAAACLANNLTKVTYPDGKTKIYHYNEASLINAGTPCTSTPVGNGYGHLLNALTGITDENGTRYASWGYDCVGRPVSSEHAGGVEKVKIAYAGRNADGSQTTTVTSYIGSAENPIAFPRQYHFKVILGVAKNDTIDQPCEGCSGMQERTYDANGNVSSSKDWNGSKTLYTYDLTRNLETSRVEAFGTPLARTVTTEWHPIFALRTKVTEPLRTTSYAYDTFGNLTKKSVQSTSDLNGALGASATLIGAARNWEYTYDSSGLILTAQGPLGDVTSYAYDSAGNLATVQNAAGHTTQFSDYDASARVGRITDPNGLATDLTYTARGWLESSSRGGETASYQYDGVGQLLKATMPDGSYLSYSYDPAHRLKSIADNDGNSITYTLDLVGNRIAEKIKDASGTLARQTSRVFDSLNRLTQVTGAQQ